MNIILMTVLLTVAGMCLLGFLTWVGIMSYKFMKHAKMVKIDIEDLNNRANYISDLSNQCSRLNILVENQTRLNEDLIKQIDLVQEESNKNIHNVYNELDTKCDILNKKIDSRVDKLTDRISIKCDCSKD